MESISMGGDLDLKTIANWLQIQSQELLKLSKSREPSKFSTLARGEAEAVRWLKSRIFRLIERYELNRDHVLMLLERDLIPKIRELSRNHRDSVLGLDLSFEPSGSSNSQGSILLEISRYTIEDRLSIELGIRTDSINQLDCSWIQRLYGDVECTEATSGKN